VINLDDNIKSVSTSTISELLDTLSPYEEVNEKAIDLLNINLHIKPIGLFLLLPSDSRMRNIQRQIRLDHHYR
jgi:hypothetical protein